MRTEEEALRYIHGFGRFSGTPGLGRIRAILSRLGNPQDSLRYVHIAGTNGKGSTAAMTAAALSSAGHRTGLYTSPYLESFRERIRIGEETIRPELLAELTGEVREAVDALLAEGMEAPGEFEVTTAVAFLAFLRQNCDITVLETGLGGRFDATNAIRPPLIAAITSISLDHTKVLGDTVPEITREKCGILKTGCLAVASADQPAEAMEVIRRDCDAKGIPLTVPDLKELEMLSAGPSGSEIRYRGESFRIPLMGGHQVCNALTALEILRCLNAAGVPVFPGAAAEGIGRVYWPGRLEYFPGEPGVLLDSAHNPGGAAALVAALDSCFPGTRPVTVMGMFADKDYGRSIFQVASRSRIFIAAAPEGPRALRAEVCAAAAAPFCGDVRVSEDLEAAIKEGRRLAGGRGLLLICGSITLAGKARTYLRG
ncbi:bifunctional folylpolyglutamate synthase/dihydrofolate synthase [Papillibacter cinnamivorans]|uniref:tetrahydrofolate synthase n=1 Tax=Papillibacter cinnamivorans DSM 12816 TaxID=1122930 RepID=A0A1W1ZGP8_9FIRM|nr:folylpolyglutamate synthase/dihydrofolate synthase family protein [Papillibacter cinnamivorans]SMC47715.1 dihydrofolate synthase / folylpolyglutamate synthase [Papillibacter cinnamivorans DSM 12816]